QAAPPPPPPPPPAAAGGHVAENGRTRGPFDRETLAAMAARGEITGQTLIWKPGAAGWAPASQDPDLGGLFPPPPPPADA
ncbi:MAG: DUF4339 domain-containing protein, partial [Rubrimonas sp.]